jgi:molybdopterin-guanine dinucleotide biosynthesis protein A
MSIQDRTASQFLPHGLTMRDRKNHICADATLAVLTGGQSRRMGVPKASLRIEGVPILEFLHRRLKWPGPTLLVDAPGRAKPPGHELFQRVVTDPVAGEGPLRGVMTALDSADSLIVVVIPVDMPCMTIEALGSLVMAIRQSTANSLAMFQRDGRLQPLPAAFDARQARLIVREQLQSGNGALGSLTDVMKTALVRADPSWSTDLWVNLNHPADLEDFMRDNSAGGALL